MAQRSFSNGEVELVADTYGDPGGPPVLLLHGWPDTSALWEPIATRLAARGHHVIAPDLRGCGRSSKPDAIEDYRMHHLVADVLCVLGDLGGRVHLVGHDWGSNLAWATAAYAPESLASLTAISVGHPTSFRSAGIRQQVRSWYTLLFEHEDIPEEWLLRDDADVMRTWLGHPRADEVVAAYLRDQSLRTHLHWYRANITARQWIEPPPTLPAITVPVLGVWSSGDIALCEEQMTDSARHCEAGFEYLRVDGVGHWIPIEQPELLADAMLAHFASHAG